MRETRRATDSHSTGTSTPEHWFRRGIHLAIVAVPFIYYGTEGYAAPRDAILISACACILLLEAIRMRRGWLLPGQREHERHRVSGFAWGASAITVALLAAPAGQGTGFSTGIYGFPLIAGLALIDPVMGEVRRITFSTRLTALAGTGVSAAVWGSSHALLETPLQACFLLALLAVAGELFPTRYVDDNATIVLYPLSAVLLLEYLA